MIHVFNRANLFQDPNAEAAAKIRSALKEAGIPYKMKKAGSGSANPAVRIPRTGKTGSMSPNVYMAGGIPHSWAEGGSPDTLYVIYVLKKDLKRAKEVCGLSL